MPSDAPFRIARGGSVRVRLDEREADLLAELGGELRALFEGHDSDDPVMARLFPRAYLDPTEEEAEAQWQALVHPELLRERLDALAALGDDLAKGTRRKGRVELELGPDDVPRWLGVLNDARLVLGTRLGVTEETDAAEAYAGPQGPAYAVYGWLTWLEGELVDTLLGH